MHLALLLASCGIALASCQTTTSTSSNSSTSSSSSTSSESIKAKYDVSAEASEGINLKSQEERRKLRANIFDEVKTTMMKFWNEKIDDEELDDCICNRIYKYAGYYMPPEFD